MSICSEVVEIKEVDLEYKPPPILCRLCGKKLRKFRVSQEYDNRIYHKKCFEIIVNDVRNFHKVAFTKYNYEKKYSNGLTLEENRKDKNPLVVTFD